MPGLGRRTQNDQKHDLEIFIKQGPDASVTQSGSVTEAPVGFSAPDTILESVYFRLDECCYQ